MEKHLHVYLKIVCPVHIGCDDVYEPTEFFIDSKKKKLVTFEPIDFIKALSPDEKEKFSELCMQGELSAIPQLYLFIEEKASKSNTLTVREIDIAAGLITNYARVKSLVKEKDEKKISQELNQFTIRRTAYNSHTNLPYIPGSSVKGSLRTAYLNRLAKSQGIKGWKGKGKKLEEKLLQGSFDTDPFRLVKVSDFLPVGEANTKIVFAVNKKKIVSKFSARGPYQILETIKPGAVFEGTISIFDPLPNSGIDKAIVQEDLFESLQEFYHNAFDVEHKLMQAIKGDTSIYGHTINSLINNRKGNLIRIGRHSGAEAVTIEGNRSIKIMQGKNKPPKYQEASTTIWLASEQSKTNNNTGLMPFGWVILSSEPISLSSSDGVVSDQRVESTTIIEKKQLEKYKEKLLVLKPTNAGTIASVIDNALATLESDEEKKEFALAVKAHMGDLFKKSKVIKERLTPYLG